jgi:hypothetical protein
MGHDSANDCAKQGDQPLGRDEARAYLDEKRMNEDYPIVAADLSQAS